MSTRKRKTLLKHFQTKLMSIRNLKDNPHTTNDSVLVISSDGKLVRVSCPFWVLVVQDVDIFVVGDLTLVETVYGDTASNLVYLINDKQFHYYLFQIEEI